jgi:bacterioferritin
MATRSGSQDILAEENRAQREEIVALLTKAYWMELETVISHLTSSINPDGVRAREIAEVLEEDIQEELGHARLFARRIKDLYGVVPGSLDVKPEQKTLQPPAEQTDIDLVIRGVIEAENGGIAHYTKIVEATDGVDPVTNDMVIEILGDEQSHRRMFEGFLKEYESERRA